MDATLHASSSADEVVDLVDEDDAVVGTSLRSELRDGVDRWRIVSLLVVDTAHRQVLLARRAADKRHDPGRWAPCVAGTVSSGDHYLDTLLRETAEEIGVRLAPDDPTELYRGPWDSPGNLRMMGLYLVRRDVDLDRLDWDRSEADAMAWWSLSALAAATGNEPRRFSAGVPRMVELLAALRP